MDKKNRNVLAVRVIGFLLIIFGMIGVIPSILNKDYIYVIPLTPLGLQMKNKCVEEIFSFKKIK